mmetsp:Transcript_14856/g.49336  ORF Transcript_14856/g.49336 Transcript_14856/m.49336 type:complete len:287 (+) Transcript_14856:1386-2246(+)
MKLMQCIPRRRRNLDPVKGLTVAAETTETPKPAMAHAITAGSASAAARRRMAYPYCCTLVLASSKHSGSAAAIWKRPCSPLLRLSRGSIISGGSQAGGGGGDGAGEREAEAKASPSSRGLLLLSASAVGNTAVGVATGEALAGKDSSNCAEGTRVPLRSFRRTHCDSLSTIEERYSAGSGSMRNTSPPVTPAAESISAERMLRLHPISGSQDAAGDGAHAAAEGVPSSGAYLKMTSRRPLQRRVWLQTRYGGSVFSMCVHAPLEALLARREPSGNIRSRSQGTRTP